MGMRWQHRKWDMIKRRMADFWLRLPSLGAYLIILSLIGIPAAAQEQASIMGRTDGGVFAVSNASSCRKN